MGHGVLNHTDAFRVRQPPVPAMPSSIIDPIWDQFAALLPPREDHHPLGCHRPRTPDRLVFDRFVQGLVFGCAYRRRSERARHFTSPTVTHIVVSGLGDMIARCEGDAPWTVVASIP
jgi:transposase